MTLARSRSLVAPLWLLVLVTMNGTLAMHMFVPALPYAALDLHATVAQMQATIGTYILGLAFGQLLYGPLSDAYGRRPVLLVGLLLYSIGGAVCALTSGVHALIAARLLQALGGCAGLALGRAIVRDTSAADVVVRRLALMNLVLMVGPGVAPIIGSAVASLFNWRGIFGVLSVMGMVTLVLTWRLLPETATPTGRFNPRVLVRDYRLLLGSRAFIGFAIGGGFTTTSIYAFLSAAPFVFVQQLHRPLHEVGFYLGLMILGMGLGNAITARLVRAVPLEKLLLGGTTVALVSACCLVVVVLTGLLTLASVLALTIAFTIGVGAASPAALAKAMGSVPHLVGSAAGFYGFTQMAAGAGFTAIASFGHNPALAAALTMAGAALVGQLAIGSALTARHRPSVMTPA